MKKGKLSREIWVILVGLVIVSFAAPKGVRAKTLKIGALLNFEFPLGVQCKRELDALVPVFNKKGGLEIQGERYTIDLIVYDSKFQAETARAAVERLIYRDRVKFILGDETTDAWLPVTEANKVLVVCTSPSPVVRSPGYKYVFQASSLNTMSPVAWAWFSEKYPHMRTVGSVFTDDLKGHAEAENLRRLCKVFGQKILDIIFYPPDTTDFSAIATRLKTLNPDVFTTCAGGPVQDALSMKAMREAGWNGQIFLYVTLSPGNIKKVISLDYVEGMLGSVAGTEMPSPPPVSQEFRDIYIAKYGKWDNPEVLHVNTWYLLMEALRQSQSLDPEKVASHIAKGMRFVTPQAEAMTISRPDLNNPRAVDVLYEVNIGRIKGGEFKIVENIPIEQGRKYLKVFFAGKK
ncbi:MAG: ABC transporter substrate-binding protein [Deltaproteobacteria bacterium]|nr:ABC transporter substrate-binding protein [Deltaproteobacteria bacterium]